MEKVKTKELDAKSLFIECGTCSQTFGHLLNREFGYPKDAEVRALDPLAGGLMNQGHQCGMIWGAALAIGAEANRRNSDSSDAKAAAIVATQVVLDSFENKTTTHNCREIIGIDLSSYLGLLKFIFKTTIQGKDKNTCFKLADEWASDAVRNADKGLAQKQTELQVSAESCASLTVKEMGANEEEQNMVAGFAGGLGLSGNACGALAAAIWYKTLLWCKDNPGKNPPYFNNKPAKKIFRAFKKHTNDVFLCSNISGKHFESVDDHSEFVQKGGCGQIIKMLAHS